MVTNPTLNLRPVFQSPRNRLALGVILSLLVAVLATVLVITASANPPAAAELRITSLVNQLEQDRLTAQRHNAQRELEALGADAVPALVVGLRSQNPILRRNAADMLGFIASARALGELQYALAKDNVPAVRRNAAWALGEINSFAAIPDLQRAAILDANALVRTTAQDSLSRIRTRIALSSGIDERNLNAYAVAPQSANVIYVAAGRDMKITQDGGATWNTIERALPSLTTVMAVSPDNPLTLYAGVDSKGMYKSGDGGRTWAAINKGLEIVPGGRFVISAITLDATDPQRVIIATGVLLGTGDVTFAPTALLLSENGGATWNRMNTKPSEPLTQLALRSNQLFALAGEQVRVYRLD